MIFRFETYSRKTYYVKANSQAQASHFFFAQTKYTYRDLKRVQRDWKAEYESEKYRVSKVPVAY